MAWELDSRHLATIEKNGVRDLGGTPAVSIFLQADNGERGEALIWLTPKSMGMARQSLKMCGFDVDKREISELDVDRKTLEGNRVAIYIDEYNGKPQVRIDTSAAPAKSVMAQITQALREAKKSDDPSGEIGYGDPPPVTDDDNIPF